MDDELTGVRAGELRNLLPDLTESELGSLWSADPDDFSIAVNLVLYASYVRWIGKGALLAVQDLEAMCGYREDLDAQISRLPDSDLRTYIVTQLDLVDAELASATVHATPPWRPSVASDQWWWHRTPRRTDQRLYLAGRWERNVNLPERIQRRYDAWKQSGDSVPFAEWWRERRASGDQ